MYGVIVLIIYCLVLFLSSVDIANCNPKFSGWKNFENRQQHQRRRSAWVGQADFGKFELNNIRNHSGNSQRLSVKRDQFETLSIRKKRGRMFLSSRLRGRKRPLLSFAILRLLRKHSNKQTFHCSGRESWNA